MTFDRRRLLLASTAAAFAAVEARAAPAPALRAVWLDGNPVQARMVLGKPRGPAYDVAQAVAQRLGRTLEFTAVAGTAAVLERLRSGQADIAFIAYDPSRAAGLSFTPPYLMSVNRYAVHLGSRIESAAEIDRPGVKVGAVTTDTGGLYLQRTLKNAAFVPMASADEALGAIVAGRVDVIGINGQRLDDHQPAGVSYTKMPGSFFAVPQTVAVRQDRQDLLQVANAVVADMLATGGMAASIKNAGLTGAELPPMTASVSVAEARAALAPSGRLRAAINYGNTVLAQKNEKTGELTGVSVVLAKTLAQRLGVPIDMIEFPAAGQVFEALDKSPAAWDLAFMAIEPERAVKIDFSPPYVAIDGTYLVRANSPYKSVPDLDKPGLTVSTARGAAYDLYLTRNLKNAKIVRGDTGIDAVEVFMKGQYDAAAGVRQFLADMARGKPEFRILPDRFSRIDQAMAVPRGRAPAGAAFVRAFVEEMKASGAVRKALDQTGQDAANVAPPAT